jgi:hypothetical protein
MQVGQWDMWFNIFCGRTLRTADNTGKYFWEAKCAGEMARPLSPRYPTPAGNLFCLLLFSARYLISIPDCKSFDLIGREALREFQAQVTVLEQINTGEIDQKACQVAVFQFAGIQPFHTLCSYDQLLDIPVDDLAHLSWRQELL